jgi:cobalt/nickel transport system permease protein
MHMADALLSPGIGGIMWAATAATTAYSARKVQSQLDNRKIPLMGVLGAFIFAAQMINFTIPGTGSSGHLGGGLLLAILIGPHAAFLTLSSVLTVQALFFADGGLLALGGNIFNLGFFPCFVAFPFIYKSIATKKAGSKRLSFGTIAAAIVGLQLGSFAVVLQTFLSGITSLPFASFLLVMQPIHLAIGLAEGIATLGVVSFILNARPEILDRIINKRPHGNLPVRNKVFVLLAATILIGGIFTGYASKHPDGLEWSIEKVTGSPKLENHVQPIHNRLEKIQDKTSLLPDYGFKKTSLSDKSVTSIAGLLGGVIVLVLSFFIGIILKKSNHLT